MNKILALGFVLSFLFIPGLSNAQTTSELQAQINLLLVQIAQLQAQLNATQATAPSSSSASTVSATAGGNPGECYAPRVRYALRLGMTDGTTDGQVSNLQRFLQQIVPTVQITGSFNSETEEAVKKFQRDRRIVSTGSWNTTGYGATGPRTRASIANYCASTTTSTSGTGNTGVGTVTIPPILPSLPSTPSQGACPADVQMCSNGTYVSRDPANGCAFKACSGTDTTGRAPTVITGVATVEDLNAGAILSATYSSKGVVTNGWFEWGKDSSLGNMTSAQALGIGTNLGMKQNFTDKGGLASNTIYYYRAVVKNEFGISYGQVLSFTTGQTSVLPTGNFSVTGAANWLEVISGVPNQKLGSFRVVNNLVALELSGMDINVLFDVEGPHVLTNVALYNSSGVIVAGPVDAIDQGKKFSFRDRMTIPLGVSEYELRGTVPGTIGAGSRFDFTFYPPQHWYRSSGESISPSVNLGLPVMTIQVGAVKVGSRKVSVKNILENVYSSQLTPPVAGVVFANYAFDTTNSVEDLRMSLFKPELFLSGGAEARHLSGCQLWWGEKVLTTGSNVINPSFAGVIQFTFNSPLTLPKKSTSSIFLTCNISSSAPIGASFAWGIPSIVSPFGVVSGAISGAQANVDFVSSVGQSIVMVPGIGVKDPNPETPTPVSQIPTVDIKVATTKSYSDGPHNVPYGDKPVLSWTSTNAVSCVSSGRWGTEARATAGDKTEYPVFTESTYTITCKSSSGQTATDSVKIIPSDPTLTVDLKADGSDTPIVQYNSSVMLSWVASPATQYCKLSGNDNNVFMGSSQWQTKPIIANTSFMITCYGYLGSISDIVNVRIDTTNRECTGTTSNCQLLKAEPDTQMAASITAIDRILKEIQGQIERIKRERGVR